jgi:hypothetical protein
VSSGAEAGVATREKARTFAAFLGAAWESTWLFLFPAKGKVMAKVKSKGIILAHTVGTSSAALAQIIDFEESGAEAETYDSTTLDGGVFKTYDPTGYSEPGEVSGTLFYDPGLAGHQNITDVIASPATNACLVTFPNAATTTKAFTAVGHAFGYAAQMNNGLVGTFKFKITGDPGWPT